MKRNLKTSILSSKPEKFSTEKFLGKKLGGTAITSGRGNYISNNHIVATCDIENELQDASDSCYSSQVDALTSLNNIREMSVVCVLVEQEATNNTILDSGNEKQVILDRTVNVFRQTPALGD